MKLLRLIAGAVALMIASSLPALAKEPIKIGAILAVTGPASFLGAPEAKTLEMMVADLNKKGGINGSPIELIIKDTGASPEKAFAFAKQMIEGDKVLAIIGPSTSGETMKIKNVCEEGKTLLISAAAAEDIVKPIAKWVFKTPQKDSYAVIKIFDQMKKMKISKVGLLSSNTGYGKAGKAQVEKMAAEHGLQLVANEVYDKAALDLSAEVAKVKASGAQAILNWSIEPAQSIVIKNARQSGFKGPIFQSHGFGNINYVKAAGPAAEGVIFPAGRLLVVDTLSKKNPQKKVLEAYKKEYEAKYHEDASTFGGHAYDAMIVLQKAIEKAKSTNPEAVRNAIESLKGVPGTGGIFNFSAQDHNGLGLDAFEMITVKKGKFVIYK